MAATIKIEIASSASGSGLKDITNDLKDVDKGAKSAGEGFNAFGALATAGAGVAVAALGGLVTGLFDVSAAASDARTYLGNLGTADLQSVLNDATLLESRYGADLQGVLGATRTLMQEFGVSSEEAMDMVVAGFESGLDTSGDFLDTLGEYSNLYAENGFSAEQMFSTIQTGLAGGALGTDKAADALKEFGIRIQELPDDVFGPDGALFHDLDMTREEISALAEGMKNDTISVADAFALLKPKIAALEDPIQQNAVGLKLFGTQWEDLGASAILGIDMAATGMDDLAAKADAGRNTFGSLGEIFPRVWGAFTTSLLPANDAILNFINTIMVADDPLAELGIQIQAIFGQIVAWVQGQLPGWIATLQGWGQAAWQWIVDATPPAVAQLTAWGTQLLGWLQAQLPGWMAQLAAWGQQAWQWIQEATPPALQMLAELGTQLLAYLADNLPTWIANLLKWGTEAVKWLADALPPLIVAAGEFIGGLMEWAYGTALPKLVEWGIAAGLAMIEWVATELIPAVGPAFADFMAELGKAIADVAVAIGKAALAIGTSVIDGMISGIQQGIGSVISAAKDMAQQAIDAAMDIIQPGSPSKVFTALGFTAPQGLALGMMQGTPMVAQAGAAMAGASVAGAARAYDQRRYVTVNQTIHNGPAGFRQDASIVRSLAGGI